MKNPFTGLLDTLMEKNFTAGLIMGAGVGVTAASAFALSYCVASLAAGATLAATAGAVAAFAIGGTALLFTGTLVIGKLLGSLFAGGGGKTVAGLALSLVPSLYGALKFNEALSKQPPKQHKTSYIQKDAAQNLNTVAFYTDFSTKAAVTVEKTSVTQKQNTAQLKI